MSIGFHSNSGQLLDELAAEVLIFLATTPRQAERFLALTGESAESLRARRADPMLHRALIDYVMQDESLLLSLCEERGLKPEDVARLHARLVADEN